jgi:hypothetical protein
MSARIKPLPWYGAGGRQIGWLDECLLCGWRSRWFALGNQHLLNKAAKAHLDKAHPVVAR